jgi:hypothetical protein
MQMSTDTLSFWIDRKSWSMTKIITFLKYLSAFQNLPDAALEEAVTMLEQVIEFYTDRVPQSEFPEKPSRIVMGRIVSTEVSPPIVLES